MTRASTRMTALSVAGSQLVFGAVMDESIPKKDRFCSGTPVGHLKIFVDNPKIREQFEVGKQYDLTFTPVVTTPPTKKAEE